MPIELENMKDAIWESIRGKINPRTRKPYTINDAWAMATAQYKEKNGSLGTMGIDESDVSIVDIVNKVVFSVEDKDAK
jgi:hypothetical protein